MNLLCCTVLLLALASCQRSAVDFERVTLTINNQQFEVLTAYGMFDSFMANESDYRDAIYTNIDEEFGHNAEYTFLLEAIKKEMKPDEHLKRQLAILRNINFRHIVDSAFQSITLALPGPDTKILFVPANPEYREMFMKHGIGMHAVTAGAGRIIVSIDPTIGDWQKLLPYALAHEYHHSVWTSRNFTTSDFTPLEYLVLEGKAESFAMRLFPNVDHPFLNMLTADQERKIWELIKPDLHKRRSATNDRMMYGTDEIPYGSVYAIGFRIVESLKMQNPEISDRELLDIPPEKVLALSTYDR